MRTRAFLATAAIAAALAGHGQPVQAATPFPEYNAQKGLAVINALPAWDTATGKGAIIAIVDSGVLLTHQDLKSQLVSNGYDFYNNRPYANDDSLSGHGTGLAGVAAAARNGVGIVGVAYGAKILPVKVMGSHRRHDHVLTSEGIRYAADHGANIINLSIPDSYQADVFEAIQYAVSKGSIITMAAGNLGEGGPQFPATLVTNHTLMGRAIAVGSVELNGKISDFSNRAGSYMNYYMVAPGDNILTTGNKSNNDYQIMGGTSFAAPAVAGAAALLKQLFPNLAPETIVQILLNTATDLGAPGVDEVYGHGLLNVANAVSPQGYLGVPGVGGGGGGGGTSDAAIAVAALALGGAVGYAILHHSRDADKALILDEYGRGYSMNLAKATTVQNSQADLTGLMQNLNRDFNWLTMPLSHHMTARLYYSTPARAIYRSMTPEERDMMADQWSDELNSEVAFQLSGQVDPKLHYSMGLNMDPRLAFGNSKQIQDSGAEFLASRPFGTSYLGFANTADTLNLRYDPAKSVEFKLGYNQMHTPLEYGLNSKAVLFQGDWKPSHRATLGLQLGMLEEDGSLFGGSSSNVWGVSSTDTLSLGLSGAYNLTSNTKLVANYALGYSYVNAMNNGLLRDFTGVRSNAYGLGILSNGVFRRHDTLGLGWSQPLRATAGQATLDLPIGIDAQSNIYRDPQRISLSPGGREQDVELMYVTDLGSHSRIGAHLLYQHQPNNNDQAPDAVTALVTVQSSF